MTDPVPHENDPPDSERHRGPRRIEGVRPCLQCGQDLHGQSIQQDGPTGLFFARCSECGTAAAMVEHPVIGPWGRRLGVAAMMGAILLAMLLAIGSVLILFGISLGMIDEATRDARAFLSSAIPDESWLVPADWWRANEAVILPQMRNEVDFLAKDIQLMGLIFTPLIAILGIIWSGILLGVPRRRLPSAAVILNLIAGGMVLATILYQSPPGVSGTSPSVTTVTQRVLGIEIGIKVLLGQTLIMTLGLLIGRSVLRSLACFILPPRSRGLVRVLWAVDGRKPPGEPS